MTLVYCGSLASVHSHKAASPSRVSPSRHFTVSFSGSSLQAPSCERVARSLSVPAGTITSLSLGVVGDCLIGLLIGHALQPARVPSNPVLVNPTQENTLRPEPSVCGCGSCICEEPTLLKVSGQRLPEKALPSSSTLLWASLSECVRA